MTNIAWKDLDFDAQLEITRKLEKKFKRYISYCYNRQPDFIVDIIPEFEKDWEKWFKEGAKKLKLERNSK